MSDLAILLRLDALPEQEPAGALIERYAEALLFGACDTSGIEYVDDGSRKASRKIAHRQLIRLGLLDG